MKHYGDITQIHGWDVPLVDIVTGGSPCQDLSVAGKRAGLDGERSGLFMEQIRIIKEMRDESRRRLSVSGSNVDIRHIKPRFMVWENVTGALSSNKGEDFRCVLEETARIIDKDAVIPGLAKGQKWSYAGCIMGDGWSIAWRIHDAQFWGVPQRRKRIALVADFGGQSAPEILFERKGVSGDIEPGREKREDVAAPSAGNTDSTSYTLKIRGGVERDSGGRKAGKGPLIQTELSATLGVSQDQTLFCLEGNGSRDSHRGDGFKESETSYTLNTVEQHAVCYGISSYDSNAMKSSNPNSGIYEADTSRTLDNNGGNPACNQGGMMVVDGVACVGNGQVAQTTLSDKVGALNCMHDQQAVIVGLDAHSAVSTGDRTDALLHGKNDNHNVPCVYGNVYPSQDGAAGTLDASYYKGCGEREGIERSVVYGLDRASFNQGKNALYDFAVEEEIAQPIVARGPGGVMTP